MAPIDELKKVASESDARTVNNIVRHQYRVLNQEEKDQMVHIKDMGQEFLDYLDSIGSSRELSLAKTNLEQAVMWAVKDITK